MVDRKTNPDYKQVTGHIPKDLAMEFKIHCTRQSISMAQGLETAIRSWMNSQVKNS